MGEVAIAGKEFSYHVKTFVETEALWEMGNRVILLQYRAVCFLV